MNSTRFRIITTRCWNLPQRRPAKETDGSSSCPPRRPRPCSGKFAPEGCLMPKWRPVSTAIRSRFRFGLRWTRSGPVCAAAPFREACFGPWRNRSAAARKFLCSSPASGRSSRLRGCSGAVFPDCRLREPLPRTGKGIERCWSSAKEKSGCW